MEPDPKDPLGLLVLVPEGLLAFQFDSAEITSQGIEFLGQFIPRLAKIICDSRFKKDINSIVVEGHTDSVGTDKRNWRLSQERSMSVVDKTLMLLNDMKNDKDIRDDFISFISASGRGSTEVIKVNDVENPEQSRRVVFKIRVRSLEQKIVKSIISS